ncbi:MAG: ATP-binding protein [Clostridiales bacterium]|nr:ATP-binding protein [Clostridiales bacterium]
MKTTEELIQDIFAGFDTQEDEYLNAEDGLIYCKKCHTPRQAKIETGGRLLTPYVMCRCRKEQHEKEEADRALRESLAEVSRMKAVGLQDTKLYDYCFANDSGINPEMRHAHTYVENWEKMKKDGTGLLLWGGVGTGKSFFAGCIANALLEQAVPVLMTNFARILNKLTGMYSDERNQFVDSLNRYSLLIIDDLGAERSSGFAQEQVFNVIDSRYRSKKPLIVTTNLTIEEMKHPEELARERIYDRILERCIPIKINNRNIREMNAADSLEQAKKLFV